MEFEPRAATPSHWMSQINASRLMLMGCMMTWELCGCSIKGGLAEVVPEQERFDASRKEIEEIYVGIS